MNNLLVDRVGSLEELKYTNIERYEKIVQEAEDNDYFDHELPEEVDDCYE